MKGLDRVNGAVARVRSGAVFDPAVLELAKLPGADGRCRYRPVLDLHLRVMVFSHDLLTGKRWVRDAEGCIRINTIGPRRPYPVVRVRRRTRTTRHAVSPPMRLGIVAKPGPPSP